MNTNMNIKIVEKGGIKIKNILVKKNPFPAGKCTILHCPFCNNDKYLKISSENRKHCSSHNVGYTIKCTKCDATYEGETSRKAAVRAIEHSSDLKKFNPESPLVKHLNLHPDGTEFEFRIRSQFYDALSRQADESVRIQNAASACLNSKSEFNAPKIARITMKRI